MSIIYNGFKPNQEHVVEFKPRAENKGHTVVKVITKRRGHDFAFKYTWVCECNYRMSSIRSLESLIYRHEAHLKAHGALS